MKERQGRGTGGTSVEQGAWNLEQGRGIICLSSTVSASFLSLLVLCPLSLSLALSLARYGACSDELRDKGGGGGKGKKVGTHLGINRKRVIIVAAAAAAAADPLETLLRHFGILGF